MAPKPLRIISRRGKKNIAFSGIQTPDHRLAVLLLYQLGRPDLQLNKGNYQRFIYSPTDALVSCL